MVNPVWCFPSAQSRSLGFDPSPSVADWQRGHGFIDVLVEHVLGDGRLRQHPFRTRDLLTLERHDGSDHSRAPLVGRVSGGNAVKAEVTPLLQVVLLVFAGDDRDVHALVFEGFDGGHGGASGPLSVASTLRDLP
jgi:hypothetical protein